MFCCVPLSSRAVWVSTTNIAVADLIPIGSPSNLSVPHSTNILFHYVRCDYIPFVINGNLASSVFMNTLALGILRKMLSEERYVSDPRSVFVGNQPSAVTTSNRTAESTSPTISVSGVTERSCLYKNHCAKCKCKAAEMSESSGCRSKVNHSYTEVENEHSSNRGCGSNYQCSCCGFIHLKGSWRHFGQKLCAHDHDALLCWQRRRSSIELLLFT